MDDFLRRRTTAEPAGLLVQVGFGLAYALVAIGIRFLLTTLLGASVPFIVFFPAILLAGLFIGVTGGVACLVACSIAGLIVILPGTQDNPRGLFSLPVFLLSGGVIIWLCARLRASMRELEEKRAQEHLLVSELQHRVKNTLAVVQALASQTFRSSADDPQAFRQAFSERLVALGKAHTIISESGLGAVNLRRLVTEALEPFAAEQAGRFLLDGEEVMLPSEQVVVMALCLHELATNASKYGALSAEGGKVDVRWTVFPTAGGQKRLRIVWSEIGGPAVAPPTRRGFGSRLLEQGLAARSRSEVAMTFPPEGLRWQAAFDLSEAA